MTSPSPFAGVISPKACWAAHGNELRVHSIAHLEGHAGHGTTGLPEQALFRFSSTPASGNDQPRRRRVGARGGGGGPPVLGTAGSSTDRERRAEYSPPPPPAAAAPDSPAARDERKDYGGSGGGGGVSPRGRGVSPKLSVQAVEAIETRDGRTVLLCLVSERGLPSEVHCVDPFSAETLHVVTGLPVLLTCLAVVPRFAPPRRPRGEEGLASSGGAAGLSPAGGGGGGEGEVVVAVGGVGGRVNLVGLQIPTQQPRNVDGTGRAGSAAAGRGVASGRRPALDAAGGGGGVGVPSEREGVPITSLASFSVPSASAAGAGGVGSGGGFVVAMVAAGWSDGSWAVAPCRYGFAENSDGGGGGGGYCADPGFLQELEEGWKRACSSAAADLATGDTAGLGPALHFVYQEHAPVPGHPSGAAASPGFRLWVSTASGFLGFEIELAGGVYSPQAVLPAFREERALIPGVRPQHLRAMLVGGGPPRPLIIFSSVRPSDGSPVLAILDIASATAAAAAADDGGGGDGDYGSRVSRTGLKEVELATRCCSKGVFSASPQAVFVNPAELKAFVSGGVPGGDGEGVVPVPRQALAPDAPTPASPVFGSQRVHLKFSVVVAEASVSEAGRPRLRAWEQPHVGDAHAVAGEVERLGLLAFCDPAEEALDDDTALDIDIAGEASLEHIVGGLDSLWARPFFSARGGGGDDAHGEESNHPGRSSSAGDGAEAGPEEGEERVVSLPRVLLSARLQGAVAMGRAPAVARALTAVVSPFGGEWMLPRARPVQEWAASVALEAWDETCYLLAPGSAPGAPPSPRPRSPASWLFDALAPLEAVARRSRQVERILEASIERCRKYCEAAATAPATGPATTAGGLRLRRRRPELGLAQQLAAAARLAETAPLLSALRRALAAARLSARVSSAASWLIASGFVWPPAASAASASLEVVGAGAGAELASAALALSAAAVEAASEATGPAPQHPVAAAPMMKMVVRLRARAGLAAPTSPETTPRKGKEDIPQRGRQDSAVGGASGASTVDAPAAVLLEVASVLRAAFEDAGEGGLGKQEELAGSRSGKWESREGAAVDSLLERGLAVVAYSVMNAVFLGDWPPSAEAETRRVGVAGTKPGVRRGGEEVAALKRAEALAHRFCEQVRLSPESRVQARISWLLDNSSASSGGCFGGGGGMSPFASLCVSTAAAALVRPRASACLAADPDLVALAGATLAKLGESGGGGNATGGGGGGEGGKGKEQAALRAAAVLPLAEDLLRAAGMEARGRLRDGLLSGQKRQRDSALPLAAGGAASDGVAPARGDEGSGTPARGGTGDAGGRGSEDSHKKRALGGWQQQRSQQQQQHHRQSQLSPAASTPAPQGSDNGASRRDRGCTVWETPRGVGLTPKTPGARRGVPFSATRNDDGGGGFDRPGCPGSASSVHHQPRARGQTVWETPRGVGLTPETPGARRGMPFSATRDGEDTGGRGGDHGGLECSGSASSVYRKPRARGQTVWETPRGVGLTPKIPNAASQSPHFSAETGGRKGIDTGGGGGGGVEECKGEETPAADGAPGTYQQPRARGQTVWETPRGVGLTPKTPGAARTARSLISAHEAASPAAWSAASGSSSASPIGGHGQREVRSYAQGGP